MQYNMVTAPRMCCCRAFMKAALTTIIRIIIIIRVEQMVVLLVIIVHVRSLFFTSSARQQVLGACEWNMPRRLRGPAWHRGNHRQPTVAFATRCLHDPVPQVARTSRGCKDFLQSPVAGAAKPSCFLQPLVSHSPAASAFPGRAGRATSYGHVTCLFWLHSAC